MYNNIICVYRFKLKLIIYLFIYWFFASEMMDTWTKQMGYPIINVEIISPTEYSLKQTRFLSNPSSHDEEQEESEFK